MTFTYTKEMMFSEFKDATKKDQKGKKEKYDNRIKFLKEMKQLKKDNPSVMRDISINQKQFDNLMFNWFTIKVWDPDWGMYEDKTYLE